MALTPEEIERRDFASSRRGYDRDEVRSFLEYVGRTMRGLQDDLLTSQQQLVDSATPKLPPTPDVEADKFGAIGERVAELLRVGHDSAAELRANAESEAEELLSRARTEADRMTGEAEATLASARSQAEAMVSDARSEAEGLLGESRLEADSLMANAEQESHDLLLSARNEAESLRSAAGAEAERLMQEAETEANELRLQANNTLTDAQTRADELWASAEGEAYKLREDGRLEAEKIREEAIADALAQRETAELEVNTLRSQVEAEVRDERERTNQELGLLRSQTEVECQRAKDEVETQTATMRAEAEQLLATRQEEAETLHREAAASADQIVHDAQVTADRIRIEGEAEADRMRVEADSFVETRRAEAEQYYTSRQHEAEQYVSSRHAEADEYVAARQGEVYKNAAEAEAERDRAIAGIADVRQQVKELLEQARAQAEFVRQEADELIRAKIRANIDQAERRISRMRITEQASRDRIIAAQSELQSAINRLDSEPMQEIGDGTDDEVMSEATERVLGIGNIELGQWAGPTSENDIIEVSPDHAPLEPVDELAASIGGFGNDHDGMLNSTVEYSAGEQSNSSDNGGSHTGQNGYGYDQVSNGGAGALGGQLGDPEGMDGDLSHFDDGGFDQQLHDQHDMDHQLHDQLGHDEHETDQLIHDQHDMDQQLHDQHSHDPHGHEMQAEPPPPDPFGVGHNGLDGNGHTGLDSFVNGPTTDSHDLADFDPVSDQADSAPVNVFDLSGVALPGEDIDASMLPGEMMPGEMTPGGQGAFLESEVNSVHNGDVFSPGDLGQQDDMIVDGQPPMPGEVTITTELAGNKFDDADYLEQPVESQDEDALSRLVREAMQRAVESARGGEQS